MTNKIKARVFEASDNMQKLDGRKYRVSRSREYMGKPKREFLHTFTQEKWNKVTSLSREKVQVVFEMILDSNGAKDGLED